MRERSAGVIIRDDKVLLFHRNRKGTKYYVFPGGGVDEGETPEEAVKREMREELGIEIDQVTKLCEGRNSSLDQYEYFFHISSWSGEPIYMEINSTKNTQDNTTQIQWIPIGDLKTEDDIYPKIAGMNVIDELKKLVE